MTPIKNSTMNKVICNSIGSTHACNGCGAAKEHDHDSCEPCPINKEAKCVEVERRPDMIIKQKHYNQLEVDLNEKDIVQIFMNGKEDKNVIQIERENLSKLILILESEIYVNFRINRH